MTRHPYALLAAYRDTGALAAACPHCAAEPGQWCTRPDGRVRRTPCIDRITATGAVTTARDFSEPTHRKDE